MKIKEQIEILRNQYDEFLKKHPQQQNESIINKFLILISDYDDYELLDHPLDKDAFDFQQRYKKPKIKTLQFPRTPKTFVEDKELAPILSSGEKLSDISVRIKDFINDIKSFVAINPVAWVVGGTVNDEKDGSKNDVDILITIPSRNELEKIVMFRIARMVSQEIRNRISFLPEANRTYVGPYTSNLPLFRLTVERIPDAEVIKMAEETKVKLRIKSEEVKKRAAEANKAIKDDKITPAEFYKPAKPVRGYTVGKAQTLDLFLDIYDQYYSYPVFSSKKYDGERIIISKVDDKITIFSEDGSKIDKLKNLKEQIKKLKPEVCVIESELENWNYKEKQHLPRESVDTGIDDDNFVSNIFECLYFKGSIPDDLYEEIEYFDKEGIESWKEKYLKSSKILSFSTPDTGLEDHEYLLHHIEVDSSGKETIHHCHLYDHLGNLFTQTKLVIKDGKVYIDGRLITEGIFHIIGGLESSQDISWSDEEAIKHGIKPKKMRSGMKYKDKAKEWSE